MRPRGGYCRVIVAACAVLFFLSTSCREASGQGQWYAQLSFGQYAPIPFLDIPVNRWDLQKEYLISFAVGKELWRFWDNLGLEGEGQAVGHWGRSGGYMEYVVAVNMRWHRFPWDSVVATTVGFGEGLSYAPIIPDHEREGRDAPGARLLNYLMYEVTLARFDWEHTRVFFRVHHRSGVFGLFHGVHGASNYPSVGIRFLF